MLNKLARLYRSVQGVYSACLEQLKYIASVKQRDILHKNLYKKRLLLVCASDSQIIQRLSSSVTYLLLGPKRLLPCAFEQWNDNASVKQRDIPVTEAKRIASLLRSPCA